MLAYQTNEARFQLPDHCIDRSITAFIVPRKGPLSPNEAGEFSFVMTREEVPEGTSLMGFAAQRLEDLGRTLPGYRPGYRLSTVLDRRPAEQAEFTWDSDGNLMHQQQTYVLLGRTALTLTATALETNFARHQATLSQILRSMEFTR